MEQAKDVHALRECYIHCPIQQCRTAQEAKIFSHESDAARYHFYLLGMSFFFFYPWAHERFINTSPTR
jgi:hypothetical protein